MVGYYHDKKDVLDRLKRIEGQVRGLQRLVDEDQYCIDVLTQISAVNSALKKVAVRLLDDHISHCVAETVAGGGDSRAKITEATAAIDRLLKS
jgi:CsoR family transcriptional regulator, copper-sensing transcriptional repressor